jgi:hypothetical protein
MKNINNLTTSHFNKQFRTIIGHLPDSIGRTPDVTHFYFVYNYSCNKEPGTARTENSTPALVRNRARMLTISSLIFLREMWFGIPSLLRIFVGHAPALFASCVRSPASLSPEGGQKGMNGTQEVFYQERYQENRQDKRMDRDGGG